MQQERTVGTGRRFKWGTIGLTLTMAATTALTACSKSENTTNPASSQSSTTTTTTTTTSNVISDKPVSYTWFLREDAAAPLQNDWAVVSELKKKTNVEIKFRPTPESGADEKRNIMISTDDVTDFMGIVDKDARNFGPQGVFLKLNDLIEQHAPNLKNYLKEYPEAKARFTASDGGIYAVPVINLEENNYSGAWLIRRDLIKDNGWKNPTNEQEFYNLLKQFKEKYPNSQPLNFRLESDRFYEAFTMAFLGYITKDGSGWDANEKKYKSVVGDKNFKAMLEFTHKLYAEKLLDQEFASMSEAMWQQRILNSQSFITYDNRSRQNVLTDQAVAADSKTKFDMFAFEPWAAPSGKKSVVTSPVISTSGIALSGKIKDPKTAIKFLDYLFGKEGSSIFSYGIEGVSYKMENGQMVAQPPYNDPSNSSKLLKKNMGARYPGVETIHRGDLTGVPPRDKERDAMYSKYFVPSELFLPSTKEEDDKLKNADFKKYFQEETVKFVMGRTAITDENLATFGNNLNKLGLGDIVKMKNDQYQRAYGK